MAVPRVDRVFREFTDIRKLITSIKGNESVLSKINEALRNLEQKVKVNIIYTTFKLRCINRYQGQDTASRIVYTNPATQKGMEYDERIYDS